MPNLAVAGCVQRAGALLLYMSYTKYSLPKGSCHRISWVEFCNVVPVPKVMKLIDQWLLSSGAASVSLHSQCTGAVPMSSAVLGQAPGKSIRCASLSPAGNARFDPSTCKLRTYSLFPALQLMRMIACCRGRAEFLGRSGMLLRCVHLLRHILAACPATPEARMLALCRRCMVSIATFASEVLSSCAIATGAVFMCDCHRRTAVLRAIGCAALAQVDRGDGASRRKLLRPPAEPARMPWEVEHGCSWRCGSACRRA